MSRRGTQLDAVTTRGRKDPLTIHGRPRVSDKGQRFIDDAPETTITIRDAANTVRDVIKPFPGGPPETGVRMGVGAPSFSEGTSAAGAPVT